MNVLASLTLQGNADHGGWEAKLPALQTMPGPGAKLALIALFSAGLWLLILRGVGLI